MEEVENHGDAYQKFQAIEKKAVKAIFSSKVWKGWSVVLILSISVLDDSDQWSVIITLIFLIFNLYMTMIWVFQVLEHKIEAAEIAILAKSYIKRFRIDV